MAPISFFRAPLIRSSTAILVLLCAPACGEEKDDPASSGGMAGAEAGSGGTSSAHAGTGGKGGSAGKGGTNAAAGASGEESGGTGVGGTTGGDGSTIAGAGGEPSGDGCPTPSGTEEVHDGELTEDTTWSGVHVIGLNFFVHSVLTLEPCTVVKFTAGNDLVIEKEGSLHAVGKPGKPVTFTSDRRTPSAGDWSAIAIANSASNDSTLEHVVVEYAKTGIFIDEGITAALSDVVVRHTTGTAIQIGQGAELSSFEDVAVEDAGACLLIGGNDVRQLGSFSCTDAIDATITVTGRNIDHVTQAATWKNFGVPYKIINNSGYLNAVVELDPGVEIQMAPGVNLWVLDGGALRALGTEQEHVVIQSNKPGPAPGDWGTIVIEDSASSSSLLRWTDVRHADAAVGFVGGGHVSVENVDFSESACGVSYATGPDPGTLTEVDGSDNDLGATCP